MCDNVILHSRAAVWEGVRVELKIDLITNCPNTLCELETFLTLPGRISGVTGQSIPPAE